MALAASVPAESGAIPSVFTSAFTLTLVETSLPTALSRVDGSPVTEQTRTLLHTQNRFRLGETTNLDLVAYAEGVTRKRANNTPTVPTTIGAEKRANPFLRADDPKLQAFVGHPGDVVDTFAEVRERKNRF